MIDTDKHEGHTPAEEWGDIVYADGYLPILLDDDVHATDSDRRLMADAPLLLEEVKALRKIVINFQQELKPLRELNFLLQGKYDILKQLKGFDEILELIG